MTLVFGKQNWGDVFQRKLMKNMYPTHFLHFVTGRSLIAWKEGLKTIVQTKMTAVKRNSISSVMRAKPAYQMVTILLVHSY